MPFPSAFAAVYAGLVAAILGLCMGSFFNCAAWRMTHGERVSHGRSHCPSCRHLLAARDLVPILSWLRLRGRCRYCGAPIPARYPLSELVTAVVFVSITERFALSPQTIEYLLFASLLLCAAFTDLYDFLIPDRLILGGIVCRAVFLLFGGNVLQNSLQALLGGLSVSLPVFVIVAILEKRLQKEAMGGGDLKLLFMMGLYLNWKSNLLGLLLACLTGIAGGLFLQRARPDRQIPFGPFLAGGWLLALLTGEPLINWYLSLFL